MPLPRIIQECAIARHKRQTVLSCRSGKQSVGRIAVDRSWKASGLDENARTERQELNSISRGCVVDKLFYGTTQANSASDFETRNFENRDCGYVDNPRFLPLLNFGEESA